MIFRDGIDTHLYCASAMGVNYSFAFSSKQIHDPGRKLVAKTLSISIHELSV